MDWRELLLPPPLKIYLKEDSRNSRDFYPFQYKELPFILGVRDERRKGTDLDSIESFMGEVGVKRLQNEADIGRAGSGRITGTVAIGRQVKRRNQRFIVEVQLVDGQNVAKST
jgi:hypothetical protein